MEYHPVLRDDDDDDGGNDDADGGQAVRMEYHPVLRQLVLFTLDILEGGEKGPRFRVSMGFSGGSHPVVAEGRRASLAWKDAMDALCRW